MSDHDVPIDENDASADDALLWNVSFAWPNMIAATLAAMVGYALDDVVSAIVVYVLVMLFPVANFAARVFAQLTWNWWLGEWIRAQATADDDEK